MRKENIAVIFGGKSAEHDISIITGIQVINNIDREKYDIVPLYLSRKGVMFFGKSLAHIETFTSFNEKYFKKAAFCLGSKNLFIGDKNKKQSVLLDCAVLCCHGLNGEDGTLQGLLQLCEIPYTSCGVLSSAICMDKIVMKNVLEANDILTAEHTYFNKIDYVFHEDTIIKDIEEKLGYPVFVKPANLGSSIGISKCKNRTELQEAIDIAQNYDDRILVEKSIENNVEVNCAVMGNLSSQIYSAIEYPKSWGEFLSFDEKYITRNANVNNAIRKDTKISKKDKKLPPEIEKRIQELAIKVFKVLSCSGIVRIDFLVETATSKIYVNEPNSIPGSLAFYLFKNKGLDFKLLLNRLIDIAKKEKIEQDKHIFSYKSDAILSFEKGHKSGKK